MLLAVRRKMSSPMVFVEADALPLLPRVLPSPLSSLRRAAGRRQKGVWLRSIDIHKQSSRGGGGG